MSVELLRMISTITDTPDLMNEVREDREERVNMCNALKKLQEESKMIGRSEGRMEGREEATIDSIVSMIEFGVSKEQIMTKYSEDEYNKAAERLNKMNV